jgi:hypothetical protein
MARKSDSMKEIVNSEGTDKYAAGVYKRSDNTLFGPLYAMTASGACVITALKNADGDDIYTNYVANGVALAAGEKIFFREVVHEITLTVAPALFHYHKQEVIAAP